MSESEAIPTRSMGAQSPPAAGSVARARRAQPNGWWGMALFLCAETTLFGTLLATYFYLDFDSGKWPPVGIKPPSVVLPLVATGVLLFTSVPMALAARAANVGDSRRAWRLIALAVVVQCCYLAAQILLFGHDLGQFSPRDTAYGSIYFTMLAAHHGHVALGILINVFVMWRVATAGLNNYRLIGVRTAALYWHVVNVLAVFVVLTQLAPSL
jgi:heme/copper-type cytochrome/quinol oxidase subunit 3